MDLFSVVSRRVLLTDTDREVINETTHFQTRESAQQWIQAMRTHSLVLDVTDPIRTQQGQRAVCVRQQPL